MSIIKWKSNDETMPVFSNFFDNFLGRDFSNFFENSYSGTVPAVNVIETKEDYKVEVAAPGLNKDDFKLNVDHNLLTIKAEKENRKEEKEHKYTRKEFSYSSFVRSFTLPETIESDKIDAKYKEGVLTIVLPKKEELKEKPAKEIKIS